MKFSITSLVLAAVFHLSVVTAAAKDYYGTPCATAFEDFYYGCSATKPAKLLACQCANEIYQMSVVNCITNHTSDADAIAAAYKGAAKVCKKANVTAKDFKAAAKALKKHHVLTNLTLTDMQTINMTEPFAAPESYLEPFLKATAAKANNPSLSRKLASGLLAYWALVLLLRICANMTSKYLFPVLRAMDSKPVRRFRKHILLPPTFKYTHSSVYKLFKYYSFNIPTRFQTLILIGFFIIRFVLYFTNYPVVMPNFISNTVAKQITSYLAYRSGVFALTQIPLMLLFGGRNNFLLWITGWSLDTFNVFHRWLGRSVLIDLIIHGAAYTRSSVNVGKLVSRWHNPYFHWGVVALLSNGIIIVMSSHIIRAHRYELFLVIHLLFAIVFVMGAWYHLKLLDSERQYTYAAVAVWAFDRLVRYIRIICSGLNSKGQMKLYSDGIIKVKISGYRLWKPRPGSYAFFHFLKPSFFWQSHPFTIVESPLPEDKDKITIIMRVKNGITKKLAESLQQTQDRSTEMRMLVEGVYGSNHHLSHYDNVVMFSGGIGVTGVYSYASSLRKDPNPHKRFMFVWCVASEEALEWFKDEIDYLAQDPRFDVRVYINSNRPIDPTDESSDHESTEVDMTSTDKEKEEQPIHPPPMARANSTTVAKSYEKLSIPSAVHEQLITASGTTAFVCCGPGAMNDDVRATVARNLDFHKGRVDYFEESFSW